MLVCNECEIFSRLQLDGVTNAKLQSTHFKRALNVVKLRKIYNAIVRLQPRNLYSRGILPRWLFIELNLNLENQYTPPAHDLSAKPHSQT